MKKYLIISEYYNYKIYFDDENEVIDFMNKLKAPHLYTIFEYSQLNIDYEYNNE